MELKMGFFTSDDAFNYGEILKEQAGGGIISIRPESGMFIVTIVSYT